VLGFQRRPSWGNCAGEETMSSVLTIIRKNENNPDLSGIIKSLDAECRNCAPITPLQCITRCPVYRLKNELRRLKGTMDNPDYMKELFNVLKNETRLDILQAIVNSRYKVSQLQQELKRAGYNHSQGTISKEYLRPLMAVGLVAEARDEYYASSFGGRLSKMLGCFPEFAEKLPANSECYEEALLLSLFVRPKTFEAIEATIAPKNVSRILKRLRSVGLIKTTPGRSYIFFFKSKRDPAKETFTVIERKIYDAVACEGISAGKLAEQTGLSIRMIYKYLRRLKGKKLVFVRKTPKAYGLTCKGEKLASVLQNLQRLVEDTWNSSQQVMQGTDGIIIKMGGLSDNALLR
jgi:DNA-binding HxlR family transcriptional regulator